MYSWVTAAINFDDLYIVRLKKLVLERYMSVFVARTRLKSVWNEVISSAFTVLLTRLSWDGYGSIVEITLGHFPRKVLKEFCSSFRLISFLKVYFSGI